MTYRPVAWALGTKDWCAILGLCILTFCVYASSLGAALDVRQDDHRIIFFSGSGPVLADQVVTARDQAGKPMLPTVGWNLASDADGGRFRPINQVAEVLLPRVLGTDAFAWHLLVLLLAALTSALLFLIGRRIGGSWKEGAALALLVVLAPDPGPAKIWYMMSVKAESFGTLFLLLGLLATFRAAAPTGRARDEILPLVLIAAAMLTKEPFALLLPALLFIRLGLPILLGHQARWRDMPRLKLVVATYVGLGLLYAGAMAILIATAPPKSYGTQSLRDWSMFEDGLRMTLMQLPNQASWFLPVLLVMAACIWRCGPAALVRAFAFPFALTAIWIAPQILLYALRGGMWDHYWMPSILALAALNAWSLHLLRLKGPRFAYVLALIGLVVYLANGARTNAQAAANYVQRTLVRMEAVNALVKEVPRGGKVVIVADNKVFSEYAFSWIFFAGNAGLADATYLLYDVTQPYPTRFHKTVYFPLAPALEPAGSCDVDAIVFINPPATTDSAWARWYRSDCFHIRSFVRPQTYFSMRKLDFLNEPFTLEVAFRTQAR